MKYFLALLFVSIGCLNVNAQAKIRKLPNNINHPSINVYAPYMSFDANALIFLSDNNEDGALSIMYSFKENADWKDPIVAPKQVNSKFNFLRGYSLSADGKKMYFSSLKSPGVGGYDILMSDFKGTWVEPQNFGVPINSKGNEGSPSVTFDGNTIYFMRCDKMTAEKAENCKLFMARKKSNGQWEEPVELPATINTGNSQSPRIMADGETLIFSSDKFPNNKGGMDLYVAKFTNENWSAPVPLTFANTERDDQYVSVNALGRYLLRDSPSTRKSELIEYLIPDDIRPRGMMKVFGTAKDQNGAASPSYISVIDLSTKKRIYNGRPTADGSFLLYLMEGKTYELSIDPELGNYNYFSKVFDLTSDKIPQTEKVNAVIKPIQIGDEFDLDLVKFKKYSSDIDPSSVDELKRLARSIKKNPELKFEVQVLMKGYVEDSVASSPDLTERIENSIATQFNDIDSLGQLFKRDTVIMETIYHNDRSLKQAQAILDFLISQTVPVENLSLFGNAIEATLPEDKAIQVRVAVRKK